MLNIETDRIQVLASAKRTIELEIEGLNSLLTALGEELADSFCEAVRLIQGTTGRVIVTGMGKSGLVGNKIAATLSSTGTPSYFVHPGEASHGDLGMITKDDLLLALSWSGETTELKNILDYAARFKVKLIALTSGDKSSLAKASNVLLKLPKSKEACPHGLAPTTSTILQLALGDALAIALLEAKGFSAMDYKVFHPGGQLGAQLLQVKDLMHTGDKMPLVSKDDVMAEAIVTMSEKSFGCLGVVDEYGSLVGIITDGDLRRNMSPDLLTKSVGNIMSCNPNSISGDVMAGAAIDQLNSAKHTTMFVLDEGKPVGIIHIHDLLRVGAA